jgi:hypothetical protein
MKKEPEFKTIYAKNKTELAVKLSEHEENGWRAYSEIEYITGNSVKLIIKREKGS